MEERLTNFTTISRRAFIGTSAAAALVMTTGCSPQTSLATTEDTAARKYLVDAEFDESQPGKWVSVPCWLFCGGRCQLKAYVVDGVITRVKTDDNNADTIEEFQNRACPRGRAQRQQIFGADRIKYPMKRKSWQPGGKDVNGNLRGIDEWEKILWDDALSLVASETQRIYSAYGAASCFYSGIPFSCITRKVLPALGGYSSFAGCTSYGWWILCAGTLGISMEKGEPGVYATNDRLDLLNAETIVLHGLNPAWASGGSPAYHLWRAKEEGAEFIFIGPEYNVSASMLDAKWIPVRPGTDTAFLLAVAYEMLRLDAEQGNIIDWDFLERCTVGFDSDHMPTGAVLSENIHDYIMGNYDSTPKTPEWASRICGTSPEDITWYAQKIAKDHAVTTLYAYSVARSNGAESLPQAALTVSSMGGHFGKPGHASGPTYHYFAANDGPALVLPGSMRDADTTALEGNAAQSDTPVDTFIPLSVLWKSINDGKYKHIGNVDWVNGTTDTFMAPEERALDIRMIVSQNAQFLTTMTDVNEGITAYRNAEFVLSLSYNFTAPSQYADIVLPSTTPWEGPGYDESFINGPSGNTANYCNRETQYFTTYAVAPLYEARSDRDICYDLLDRLGLDAEAYFPYSEEQRALDRVVGATVVDDDGITMKPLVTLSQDQIDSLGLDAEPQLGVIDYKELMEKGVYHVKRELGDNKGWIAYKDFVEDPQANPRPYSESGKFELYSQAKADGYNRMNLFSEQIKPYAAYRVGSDCYEKSFDDFDAGVKGQYPLQVYTPHYLRRAHAAFESVGWLREAFENPVFMNPIDAAERGLSDGDWALVNNQFGGVLRQASILETLMPGVVGMPHGSWPEIDQATGYSFSGSENVITGSNSESGLMCGYNSVLVEITKYDNQELLSDPERPVIMPVGIEDTEQED